MERLLLLSRGELDLSSEQKKLYETDCQSFAKDAGDFILKSSTIEPTKDFKIVFFPVGLNNILNLQRKQNVYFCGEAMIAPLFYIEYDKNSQFKSFHKREDRVSTRLHFMVVQ